MEDSTFRTTSKKRSLKSGSHFHCYLLRSLHPQHPTKTYIGFTTDPHRRLRQHNGELKNGGAWKTKRFGRPWKFVTIVNGFPDHRSALQFEWAWQNVGKSLAVRNAIGDPEATALGRKRGVNGNLSILKTLINECENLCNAKQTIFFFEERWMIAFDKHSTESIGTHLSSRITMEVVASVQEMPFWIDRGRKMTRDSLIEDCESSSDSEDIVPEEDKNLPEKQHLLECSMCCRNFSEQEEAIGCNYCSRRFHEICLEMDRDAREGFCPRCMGDLAWVCFDSSSTYSDATTVVDVLDSLSLSGSEVDLMNQSLNSSMCYDSENSTSEGSKFKIQLRKPQVRLLDSIHTDFSVNGHLNGVVWSQVSTSFDKHLRSALRMPHDPSQLCSIDLTVDKPVPTVNPPKTDYEIIDLCDSP